MRSLSSLNRTGVLLAITLCGASVAIANPKLEFKTAYMAYQKCIQVKDYGCAVSNAEKAYLAGQDAFRPGSMNLADLAYNYGNVLLASTNPVHKAKSLAALEEALPLVKDAFGEESERMLALLADLVEAQGYAPATVEKNVGYWEQAVELSQKLNGKKSVPHAQVLMRVTNVPLNQPGYDSDKAYKLAKLAHKLIRSEFGESSSAAGLVAFSLGRYELSIKEYKDAVDNFNSALPGLADAKNDSAERLRQAHIGLVTAYQNLGKPERATEHCIAVTKLAPVANTKAIQPLYQPAPNFSDDDLASTQAASAKFQFTVTAEGSVADLVVVTNTFTEAMLNTLQQAILNYRYAPKVVGGETTDTKGVIYTFKL
ncbi:hypothetical protein [Teredinibacter waterburyi]|jgi:hypothetical protein|uniref:hypothetical protein n=1 Tax=Teredinibacter waterburyi TaxID=1500538 RepID=UPI00165F7E9C|nr:hypothetical protein [Teredinibacter waterburyi]